MQIKNFTELSVEQLYQILRLRIDVFSVEQNCAYQDIDNLDQKADHIFTADENGAIEAYARVLAPGMSYESGSSIGRVVTARSARGKGIGNHLMQSAIKHCRQQFPDHPIIISAQSYLHHFYESLGFKNTGDFYLEDDIPHQQMTLL